MAYDYRRHAGGGRSSKRVFMRVCAAPFASPGIHSCVLAKTRVCVRLRLLSQV